MTHKNIQFLKVTHLKGPNIWTYRPVIEVWVDIGELEDYPSNTLPGFYERLTQCLTWLDRASLWCWRARGLSATLARGHLGLGIFWSMWPSSCRTFRACRWVLAKARQTSQRGIYKVGVSHPSGRGWSGC